MYFRLYLQIAIEPVFVFEEGFRKFHLFSSFSSVEEFAYGGGVPLSESPSRHLDSSTASRYSLVLRSLIELSIMTTESDVSIAVVTA